MGFLSDLVGGITGSTQAKAARRAADIQQQAAEEAATGVGAAGQAAQDLLQPFTQLGTRGLELSGFLADPQAQFDFLQNNPLFQLSLEQAQKPLIAGAAAGGRLSAGDTLEDLQRSALVTSQPLIEQQRADILNLLGIGQGATKDIANIELGTATDVANLRTGGAAAQAAGTVGAAQARSNLLPNLLDIGSTPFSSIAPSGSIFGAFRGLF